MPIPPDPISATTRGARITTEISALWQLAWPILVGQLANVGMAVADVAMAGHASAQDLAGVALGSSIWMIVVVTLMGIMMSVNPTVAHYVGAGEFNRVPHVVRQGLWKGLGVGLIAFVLANVAALVFDHMALEPVVRDIATRFVLVASFALPAFACYRVLYGYSASLNQTKPMMAIAIVALLLNCLLNWVLIYGHWGFPKLGGVGCAWATMLCTWFNLLGLMWWMQRSPAYRSTWPFDRFEWPHRQKVQSLLKLGLPIGVTYFAESSAFSLIALLVAHFGSTQVAAHQIALNFSSLVFMLPLSLGIALLSRVGHALGAGDAEAARFRSAVGVALSVGLAAVTAALMALFSHQIAALYTTDATVAQIAAGLLFLAALFQISDAAQVSTSCAIRGYKVTRSPMVIHLTAFWIFALPLGCVLGLAPEWLPWRPAVAMQAQGFWIALVVGLTVAAGCLGFLLHHVANRHIDESARAVH
ncbi:MATE family efflux transporter [Rhodoferax sp. AJA081-3]|uniref:MATE family efflux transporter n=1 Tax=Rhodoferax sp. AJA081-3 TaxID=2752316 RepID=UPI001ADF48E8|nr:MATE family efflux transporter [Rhodoferax sp. AJA081-3]QTN28366.1 MATE family efflux transporter [Rhodoferax sp. AJA081-3]